VRFLSDASSSSMVSPTSSRLRFGDGGGAAGVTGAVVGGWGGGWKMPGPGATYGVRANHDTW